MTSPARPSSLAQAHPLFAGESPTKSPGPSSLVNRPIWGQRKAAQVDYSAESHNNLQRRSVSRTSSYNDGATPSSSSSASAAGTHRPAPVDDDVFYSRASGSTVEEAHPSTSYIPRTSRVSSYDLQFDDADEASLPDDSLFGGPAPSSPRIFDLEPPAPRPLRSSQLRASHAFSTASPDQTPMPKHHPDRPSSRASRRDDASSPSDKRRLRSPTPNGSNANNRVHDMAREVEFPLEWLQQLHRLGDGDLDSALLGPFSHRPSTSQQPHESTPVKTSSSSSRKESRPPSYAIQLTKALSRALSEARTDLDKLRTAFDLERDQHASTIEHQQQRSESREAALTSLCLENGIKQGQINRSLLRAPILDAEVLKRKRMAEQQQSIAQEKAGIEPPADRMDRALPDSLQEAMLDDLEGVANTSAVAHSPSLKPASIHSVVQAPAPERSPSIRSHKTAASVDATRAKRSRGKSLSISYASTNDKDTDNRSLKSSAASVTDSISTSPSSHHRSTVVKSSPQPPASPQMLYRSKSPGVASPRARSTSSSTSVGGGLGDWASGLLPWSAGGASRKGAPSTAQSMVKATSPGRREMAQTAAAAAADVNGNRAVSGSKSSKVASASTFARAFGRYTRSSPAPETPPPAPQPNVTRLPDTYQFDRRSTDPSQSLSAPEGSVLGAPSPRPPSAAVELEPILPNEAAPPTLIRRKTKGRKSKSGNAGLGISSSSSTEVEDHAIKSEAAASSNGVALSSKVSDTPISTKKKRSARLSTLDEEESSGDEFEVYGGKAPVPGFTNMTEHASPVQAGAAGATPAMSMPGDSSVVIRPVEESGTDSESEEEIDVLTDRYGFIYNPTDADIRLLRQARKASAPAPATLTGIKVGIRARGGTDSQSEDDKNDPDLDTADSSEDELDLSRARPLSPQLNHNDLQLQSTSRSVSPTPSAGATSAVEGFASDDGTAADSASTKAKRAKRRSNMLTVPDSRPVQAEVLPVSAVSKPSSAVSRGSPTKNRRGTRSNASSRSSSPVKGGGLAQGGLPSISNTVRRLLTQLKDMHDSQQIEQKQQWDAFLERRRVRLQATVDVNGAGNANSTSNGGSGGTNGPSAANGTSTKTSAASTSSKTKALLAGTRFGGGASADGAKALGSAEKAPEEDWSSGMVGVNRMGDSKSGKEDWREFLSLCQSGIPLCYRARIWAECSGANDVAEPGRYQELLSDHQGETNDCLTQIDLDVHRTMPTNVYFGGDGQGVPKLRRLLVAFSWYNPSTGYCQGMNNLAATLLLTHATEEEAFWVLVCLIEKILPSEYYTSHLLVSQADQRVLIELVSEHMPALHAHMGELGVDLPAITFAWFLSLYTDCLPVETLFRVWDVMFVEGMVILFRAAMAILKLYEKELLATTSASAFYGLAHSLTSRLFAVDRLISLACSELKASIRYANILEKRERHVADLTRELGLMGDAAEDG
ncbi:Rab-GAP TBC domain-containing protein [Pseudozyma hubeiensis]|nr:Rab-GAP TBC domain-containing protein [Pseudozyma hubeiensis]